MALSRQQRRALREIEEHLAAEDPALATLLRRAEGTRHERVIRGATGGSGTVAVTGDYAADLTVGTMTAAFNGPDPDIYLARLTSSGSALAIRAAVGLFRNPYWTIVAGKRSSAQAKMIGMTPA